MKRAMGASIATGLLVGVLLIGVLLVGFVGTRGANVSFSLFGSSAKGWGFTRTSESIPGPTINVNQNDVVTLSLTSTDGLPHQFLIDYNGNGVANTGEPVSAIFQTSTIQFTFTASVAGSFRYICTIHPHMYGTWSTASLNTPPTLGILSASPSSPSVGQSVTFSATAADANGDVLSYTFNFGDGTTAMGTTPAGGGPISGTHTYQAASTYTVILTVTDGKGGQAQQSLQVSVVEPQAMSMIVTSNRREMMSTEIATIDVNLVSGTTGVTGATLTTSSPLGGTFSIVRELGGGNYEFDWTAPAVPRQTFVPINVLAKASGYLDASGRVVILVDPNKTNPTDPTQLFLLVRAPATSLRAGQSMTVTVYAYTIEGFVVSGATVTLLRVGPGSVSTVSDRLNGEYTFTYTAPPSVPGPTGVLITITAAKFGYANGTARLALTVVP